ncbi:hypothetical protein K504DRAFT_241979 [Pleomassaria siparia CBS 279.74]|uniref:Uncharacterized protein n=1 Tax=Pleomassaria siparia CBS 279.74 TaxID=1314801 RepID=A0A6G1KDY1_9PLEO|nr:hypothetical protein K504DRAFT_241979 [Pleomassaria siparia CBS 279.74]
MWTGVSAQCTSMAGDGRLFRLLFVSDSPCFAHPTGGLDTANLRRRRKACVTLVLYSSFLVRGEKAWGHGRHESLHWEYEKHE